MMERKKAKSKLHLYIHMVEIGVTLEITQKLISAQRECLCHRPDLSTLLHPERQAHLCCLGVVGEWPAPPAAALRHLSQRTSPLEQPSHPGQRACAVSTATPRALAGGRRSEGRSQNKKEDCCWE